MKFGRYQLFSQTYQQGGSRCLLTLVRKDIPATLTDDPQQFDDGVDSLSVTLHLGHTTKINVQTILATGRKARVVFQGQASAYVTLESGTPQGGVISPTLFNVLMNVLATLPYPTGIQYIGYADDIVLQTQGRDSVAKLQDSLNLLTNKCKDIGFTISQTKTKAIAKTRTVPLTKLQIQGRDMEWVATYIGVIVTETTPVRPRCNTSKLNATSEIDYLKHCRGNGWEQQAISMSTC